MFIVMNICQQSSSAKGHIVWHTTASNTTTTNEYVTDRGTRIGQKTYDGTVQYSLWSGFSSSHLRPGTLSFSIWVWLCLFPLRTMWTCHEQEQVPSLHWHVCLPWSSLLFQNIVYYCLYICIWYSMYHSYVYLIY